MRFIPLAAAVVVLLLASAVVLSQDDTPARTEPAPAQTALAGVAVGDSAVVYLRGDASGVAFSDRVASTGNLISRSGALVSVSPAWVVLESGGAKHCIPREAIALVEVRAQK